MTTDTTTQQHGALVLSAKEAACIYQAFQVNVEVMFDKTIPYGKLGDFDKTFLQVYLKAVEFINNPRFVDEAKEALNAGKI